MATSTIPVIDFKRYGLLVEDPTSVPSTDLETIAQTVGDAFRTIGFAYLINHGIDDSKIANMFTISEAFFSLPEKAKLRWARADTMNGWVSLGGENFQTDTRDLKESFDVTFGGEIVWPTEVEGFRDCNTSFFHDCRQLTERLLDIISIGLKLKRQKLLRDCHNLIGQSGNITTLRSLYYPALKTNQRVKSGLTRCGEHTDFGTITFLFQDNMGGLEVQNRDGVFIPVTLIPGAVLVNIGDLMQRWTGDELKATKHRVIIPEDEYKKKKPRQSIAFFVNPNDEVEIKCLDGSEKYPPVSAIDYLNSRFNATYTIHAHNP